MSDNTNYFVSLPSVLGNIQAEHDSFKKEYVYEVR